MHDNTLDFNQVVDTNYIHLYRFGLSLTGSEYEASDLVQQTFYLYAKKKDSIINKEKTKSWLFTTLYREFLRNRRKSSKILLNEPHLQDKLGSIIEPQCRRSLDAEMALVALQKVDIRYRVPLVLYFLQSYSYQEIAEILEIPLGTVTSRIARGKEQLRDIAFKKAPKNKQ